tara:strand:+ start:14817 stop:16475 length:1659 start_codon:yes stop_codon:yes gene_type:complete
MAYKFQLGNAILSGALVQEGPIASYPAPGAEGNDDAKFQVKNTSGQTRATLHIASSEGALTLKNSGAEVIKLRAADGTMSSSAGISGSAIIVGEAGNLYGIGKDGALSIAKVNTNWTNAGRTIADLGTVTEGVISTGGLTYAGTVVTSTGAELNLVDGSSAGTVVVSKAVIYDGSGTILVADEQYIGATGDTDMLQFEAGSDLSVASDLDFNILKAGGLNLADGQVTSTAAELNLVDGSSAGTVVASKAVIYNVGGAVNGTTLSASQGITGSSLQMGAYGLTNLGALAISAMNSNWTNAGRTVADMGILTTVDINGGSADGVIIGAASAAAATVAALTATGDVTMTGATAVTVDVASDSLYLLDAGDSTMKRDSIADIVQAVAGGASAGGFAASSGVMSLKLDSLSTTLTGSGIDGLDVLGIYDTTATSQKKATVADLALKLAGAGLTATNGVISSEAGGTPTAAVNGTTLSEGYNYLTGNLAGAMIVSLPGSPTAGDVIHLKAKEGLSQLITLTVKRSGAHLFDNQTQVVLESPNAAVSFVYVANNDWRIV